MSDISKRLEGLSPKKRALLLERLAAAQALRQEEPAAVEGSAPRPPLTAIERGGPLPLSFAQQRLWFLDQLEPASTRYLIPLAVALHGPLAPAALAEALTALAARHEVLRTTIGTRDGQPHAEVVPPRPVPLAQHDLSGLPPAAQAAALAQAARQPIPLTGWPLFRASLLRQGPGHVLLLTFHHIIFDEWSVAILIDELRTLYQAACGGTPPPLPPLPLQYADYAHGQRQWLQGPARAAQRAYWHAQLAGLPPLELPTDYVRPARLGTAGAAQPIALTALAEPLHQLSQQAGATLFMTLLAAFLALLSRYSGQTDIAVGTPVAGRSWPETERLIGCFVNTLVLRGDLQGTPSFRTLLERTRAMALAALAHQELPFEQVVEDLQPQRDLSRHPLVQVLFTIRQLPPAPHAWGELTMQPLPMADVIAKFDLALEIHAQGARLEGLLVYNTNLFSADTVQRMAGHYQTLLAGLLAQPDRPVGTVPLLTAQEAAQLAAWNHTPPMAAPACLPQLFAAQATRTPDALALRCGDTQLSYAALNARANQLAHALRQRGIGPAARVGICLERSPDLVVALLATFKAGAACVPLDPAFPPDRRAVVLADAQATALLTQRSLADQLPAELPQICLDTAAPLLAGMPTDDPPAPDLADLAYLIYTSGSTGTPKGTAVQHDSLAHILSVGQALVACGPGDVLPWIASVAFDIAMFELFVPLLGGGTARILTRDEVLDMPHLIAVLRDCTCLHAVPSLMRQLVQAAPRIAPPDALADMRLVLVGGEAVPPDLLQAMQALFPRAAVHVLYGPTEATIIATSYAVPRGMPVAGHPIGRPLPHVRALVLDAQQQPLPIGVAGDLYLGGRGLSRGYHRQPALTAAQFVPDPQAHSPGQRLYRTGDRARYLPDGTLEFLGRADGQVKIRGHRVEPGEVTAALLQQPQLRDAVVVARADAEETRLVAYVVPAATDEPEAAGLAAALRAALASRLPAYMLPAHYVVLPALPLTPTGKVDRRALPAPSQAAQPLPASGGPPRDRLEQQLAQIWRDLLGHSAFGINDSFFECGGHSLLAVALTGQIAQVLGQQLPVAAIFHAPTIAQLAAQLRTPAHGALDSPAVPIQPSGARPPFFCVHPMSGLVFCYRDLAAALSPDQPVYGLQSPGVARADASCDRIERLAAGYLDAILAVQPHGPYLLGGWSMGGVVAFELARQLQQRGAAVGTLVLLDSAPPTTRVVPDDRDLLVQFAHDCAHLVGLDPTPVLLAARDGLPGDWRAALAALLAQAAAVPLGQGAAYIDQLFMVFRDHVRALAAYAPQPYHGRALLIQAAERSDTAAPANRWGGLLSGPLQCWTTPGSHYTMLSQPHVMALGQLVQQEFDAVQHDSAP